MALACGVCVLLLLAAGFVEASFNPAPPPAPQQQRRRRRLQRQLQLHWEVDWVTLFERGAREAGLNATSPTILAALSARLRDAEFGRAAVRNLAQTASDTKPDWKANDRTWAAPNWTAWNLSSEVRCPA
eukprot:SAG31_NODE_18016_length_649_cov_1.794545_1_plen_129_part_00